MLPTATHRRTLTVVATSALVAVAAIWAAVLYLTIQDRRDVLHDAETELVGTQNAISAQVERTFENGRFLLTAVDLWLGDATDTTRARTLDHLAWWISALERSQDVSLTVHLFDESGNMIRYGGYDVEAINVADRDYFRALERRPPGYVYVGKQVVGRDTNRNVIPLATRVRPNRFGIAFVVASISAQALTDAFDGLLVTAPGFVGIVREDGTLLLRTPDPDEMTGKQVDIASIVDLAPEAPRLGFITHSLRNDRHEAMTAYARLTSLPMYVYATFVMSDLYGKAWDRARPKIVTALLSSLTVVIGAGLLGFLIVQREREAGRVAEALVAADEANAAKTQFLANVSHELRTPLNAVIGFSETLAAQIFGPLSERYRGYAEDILTSGRHLLSIVDQLLDMASIEARREHLRPEPIILDTIADEVAHMMRPLAEQRGVTVAIDRPSEPILIESDTRCVRQILINLTSNAVRFSRPGGRVALTCRRDDRLVLVAVEDHGQGIPAEDLPRIFDLFWQGEDAYARRHGGIGLGLPLTKTLVGALGGTIEVESRLGVGSRFTVRLPDVFQV